MRYNVYISNSMQSFNVFTIDEVKLLLIVDVYLKGASSFTISGEKYYFGKLQKFKIFTYELERDPEVLIKNLLNDDEYSESNFLTHYLPPATLARMGKDVTEKFIGHSEFGSQKVGSPHASAKSFVDPSRLEELRTISNSKFDLARLIKLCEEMNDNFARGNFLSVGMIGRTIIHHVPPIFGFNTFEEVANNYGGPKENKSFKKSMQHLNSSLKNIADSFLHQTIRPRETLPNEAQVDFRQDLDVLLGEITRILK